MAAGGFHVFSLRIFLVSTWLSTVVFINANPGFVASSKFHMMQGLFASKGVASKEQSKFPGQS